MPMVKFPYTKEGEKKAKAAARQYGGKYVDDKKGGGGASIMIAVGTAKKPTKRKAKKSGKQFSKQPKGIAKKTAKYRRFS